MSPNNHSRHVYGLVLFLLVLGTSIFFYRHYKLDIPLTDKKDVPNWIVEANLRFVAETNKPVKASFVIPYMPQQYSVIDEYFISPNYGVTTNFDGYNRETIWSLRRSNGVQSLYYRAIFRETDAHQGYFPKPKPISKTKFLPIPLTDTQKTALNTLIQHARASSADVLTFAQSTIRELNTKADHIKLLLGPHSTEQEIIKTAILALNYAHINALPVSGLILNEQHKARLNSLLAVYDGNRWTYLHPKTATIGLPKNFLIWGYTANPLYHIEGGLKPHFGITTSLAPMNALRLAEDRGEQQNASNLMRFSLLQLPVEVQETYKILLMIPIGAFIILLLRNFIGLKTFGTFMPVLIALAFRETHVLWGIALLIIIVSFGLLARVYLEKLRLLLVPRLAAIITIVILSMIFLSIISQKLGLDSGLSIALFPMVILTMTIERLCITWDERGAQEAIGASAGSLFAALVCYFAMNNPALQYLIFAFPELLLILLAMILVFGQYKGYRLSELLRFRAFIK